MSFFRILSVCLSSMRMEHAFDFSIFFNLHTHTHTPQRRILLPKTLDEQHFEKWKFADGAEQKRHNEVQQTRITIIVYYLHGDNVHFLYSTHTHTHMFSIWTRMAWTRLLLHRCRFFVSLLYLALLILFTLPLATLWWTLFFRVRYLSRSLVFECEYCCLCTPCVYMLKCFFSCFSQAMHMLNFVFLVIPVSVQYYSLDCTEDEPV